MRLLDSWKKSKKASLHDRLVSNIEKLTKIAVVRTNNGSTNTVLEDIKWIEDNYIAVLKLHDTDYQKFKDLFDPNGRYQIRQFNNLDFNLADFINSEGVSSEHTTQKINKFTKKYQDIYNKDTHKDLTLRYSGSLLNIWNSADDKKNLILQQNILYTFANWMYIVDSLPSARTDFRGVLKSFLHELKQTSSQTIKDTPTAHVLSGFLCYRIALNRIFTEDFGLENIDLYFEYILENIYYSIHFHKNEIAKNFISSIIDGNYFPHASGGYSKFYEQVNKTLSAAGYEYEQRSRILKEIPSLFQKAFYIRTISDLTKWGKEFDNYIQSNILNLIDLDEKTLAEKEKINKYAEVNLKYNLLQQIVIKVAAIGIFKRDYSIIEFAMEYNQPSDSMAIQGNMDILPKTLPDILNYLNNDHSIEHDLYRYWDGHHGVEVYLNEVFLILFYNHSPARYSRDQSISATVSNFLKLQYNNDPSTLAGLKSRIETLKNMLGTYSRPFSSSYKIFKDEKKIERIKQLFVEITKAIDNAVNQYERKTEITENVKDAFIENIVNEYGTRNYLYQLFKKFAKDNIKSDGEGESIGVNRFIERSTFLKDWHIPTYGLGSHLGDELAEQENRNGLSVLHDLVSESHNKTIDENQVCEIIQKFMNTNSIIIGRNIFFDSILENMDSYVPEWKTSSNPGFTGNFYNGKVDNLLIFNMYDQVFDDKSFLVINTEDILGVEDQTENTDEFEMVKSFKTSFLDYATHQASFKAFNDNPPDWLLESYGDDPEKLSEFLVKQVWIRIFKKSKFAITDNKTAYYYQLK